MTPCSSLAARSQSVFSPSLRPAWRLGLSSLAISLLSALGSGPALAAEDEKTLPDVVSTGTSLRAGSPHDTVSTGSKTDTPLRDIPASVIVIPAEILAEQGVRTMNQALENVSGVQPQMAGGYGFADSYSVRGLPMRWLRDGLPDGTTQNGYVRTMFDVERIEVLKGPGSALYGAGQPGGTVNVVTASPQFRPGVVVGGQVGSFGTRAAWVDVTGPLSAKVAGRVVAGHDESDGWRGLSRRIDEVLPSLTWQVGDDKVLNIDYDHRSSQVRPDNYGIVFDARGNIADVSRQTRYYSPMNNVDQTIDRLTLTHDWTLSPSLGLRTALVSDQRSLDLVRNAGANAGNALNQMTGRTLRTQSDQARSTTFQNELVWKTQSGAWQHTVLGGVEFSNSHIKTVRVGYNLPSISNILSPVVTETALTALGAPVATQGFNRTIESNTWGLYLQDQIALGETLKLRGGLRTDRTHFEDNGIGGTPTGASGVYREIRETRSLPSGALGAVWQPDRNWSFYAGASTGQFINLATEGTYVGRAPEKSLQKEVGVKAAMLENRLGLNLAVFDTTREHYYITLPGTTTASPDGKDKTRGVELDLTAEPVRGLSLLGNFVLQNPEVTSQAVASNAIMGVSNRSIAGTLPTGVAKRSGRIWAAYTLREGTWRGLGFGLGATHKGESYADNLNLYRVPGYTVFDAAVFYKQAAWEAALNLKNLTDRTYYTSPTFIGALPGEARGAFLTVKFKM